MSLPVHPSFQPALRSFQHLRYALENRSQTHVNFAVDAVLRELGKIQGPSEYVLIARNQLLQMAPGDLDAQLPDSLALLDSLECLVFGGRSNSDRSVDTVEIASTHPLEALLQRALGQLAPFFKPDLCRSAELLQEFSRRQSTLQIALAFLQDVLVLPPEALSALTSSASPEVREWAQAVIDAATP